MTKTPRRKKGETDINIKLRIPAGESEYKTRLVDAVSNLMKVINEANKGDRHDDHSGAK